MNDNVVKFLFNFFCSVYFEKCLSTDNENGHNIGYLVHFFGEKSWKAYMSLSKNPTEYLK